MPGAFSTYCTKFFAVLLLALHALCVAECTELFCDDAGQHCESVCEDSCSNDDKKAAQDDCASDDHACFCHIQTIVGRTETHAHIADIITPRYFLPPAGALPFILRPSVFHPPIA